MDVSIVFATVSLSLLYVYVCCAISGNVGSFIRSLSVQRTSMTLLMQIGVFQTIFRFSNYSFIFAAQHQKWGFCFKDIISRGTVGDMCLISILLHNLWCARNTRKDTI